MSPTAYFNGSFLSKADVRVSPDDRGFLFSDGVYEVVRSYGGRLFELAAHLDRLAASLAGLRLGGVEKDELAPVCNELLARNGLADADALVYLQVTRGAAPRRHRFPDPPVQPTVYGTAWAFVPDHDPAAGAAVITVPDERWSRCDVKTVSLVANCLANQRAYEAGAVEAIFVRDGTLLEGTHTNVFGVSGGLVSTAPNSGYILDGITRRVVLELCAVHGIPAREEPVRLEELGALDELFLTGTTAEVTPVISVDGRKIGDGTPGPVALHMLDLFLERARGAA
jgi:D-alanine transaminase